ncbi:hypothetical protein M3O96_09385 [Aquiflexum sp. TKW24L]|uniref:hypothetical protein n=1 Tax=Aquiflexum sp. TKW24L TaxID=2942212 RepID=UPI0020C12513|nr:hypothetical protein [Aquiflexum sp. TKW24L]MCL6259299.1 hypothetical protein [Aquiflexum sp. TKW24L]
MRNKKFFVFVVCGLIFLAGCKTAKEQVNDENESEIMIVENTPEILMVNFSMDSRDSVKVVNYLRNPGRLRGAMEEIGEPGDGDLIISFLSETNMVCSKTIVPNPLIKRVEYSETDDFSTLKAKTISLDSAEFFIRVQVDDCFKHLKIEKFTADKILELKIIRDFHKPL